MKLLLAATLGLLISIFSAVQRAWPESAALVAQVLVTSVPVLIVMTLLDLAPRLAAKRRARRARAAARTVRGDHADVHVAPRLRTS